MKCGNLIKYIPIINKWFKDNGFKYGEEDLREIVKFPNSFERINSKIEEGKVYLEGINKETELFKKIKEDLKKIRDMDDIKIEK